MSEWFYVTDGERQGPITGDLVQQLVGRGVIHAYTPLWREGMKNWQTYAAIGGRHPAPVTTPSANHKPESEDIEDELVVETVPIAAKPKSATFELGDLTLTEEDKAHYVQEVLEGVDPVGTDWQYAGFWLRVASSFLDGVFFGVCLKIFMVAGIFVVGFLFVTPLAGMLPLIVVLSFLLLTYWYWVWPVGGERQGTYGQKICHLRVIRADGSAVTQGTALMWFFAQYLSSITLGVGFFMMLFDREKRTLRDMACNVRVVVD